MNLIDLHSVLADADALPRTTTLIRQNGLRALLLHLKSGEQIPEHQTRGPITVQCLSGEAIFSSGAEQVTLTPASLISLSPGAPHSVAAQNDVVLLVTISEQSTAGSV